jgi:hypothetical protein
MRPIRSLLTPFVQRTSVLLALVACTAATAAAVPVAFVTSATGPGRLLDWPQAAGHNGTGLDAGDRICRKLATDAGLPNAQAFRAWLSDGNVDAFCHLFGAGGSVPACGGAVLAPRGPWQRVDGLPVARNLPALLAGEMLSPMRVTETGALVAGTNPQVWTGTFLDGTRLSQTCGGWTSSSVAATGAAGSITATRGTWTFYSLNPTCDVPRRLYCLDASVSAPPLLDWERAGRLLFTTTASGSGNLASWPASGGLQGVSAGDAICRAEASAAHLPHPSTFKVWLSTTGVSAASRLGISAPFKRVDGMRVAATSADLLDGALLVPLNVTASGGYLTGFPWAWTGTDAAGQPDTAGRFCGGWTSSSSAVLGAHGAKNDVLGWSTNGGQFCNNVGHLYCIGDIATLGADSFETGSLGTWSAAVP